MWVCCTNKMMKYASYQCDQLLKYKRQNGTGVYNNNLLMKKNFITATIVLFSVFMIVWQMTYVIHATKSFTRNTFTLFCLTVSIPCTIWLMLWGWMIWKWLSLLYYGTVTLQKCSCQHLSQSSQLRSCLISLSHPLTSEPPHSLSCCLSFIKHILLQLAYHMTQEKLLASSLSSEFIVWKEKRWLR